MDLTIYQVDAFTAEPFKGNPAGVCITETGLDESLMHSIAAEMAVSETAFLALADMRLRWFTPQVEISLCGHATLATAHILKETGRAACGETLVFQTLSGPLAATPHQDRIEMNFPAPTLDFTVSLHPQVLPLLGLRPEQVVATAGFDSKILLELDSEQALLELTPNFDGLKQLPGRSIVVTVQTATPQVDFISRNFAPWVGVNEDPVTGSAHCALAVYWGEKLQQPRFTGYQASTRGGFVNVELSADQRVKLSGKAVTTLKGTLSV